MDQRVVLLLSLVGLLASGCLTPPQVLELKFPEEARPGSSPLVRWSVDGIDPAAVAESTLHWSIGSSDLDREMRGVRTGEGDGPVRPNTCAPRPPNVDIHCSEWNGEQFYGKLPALDAGHWLIYQVHAEIPYGTLESRVVRLEAAPP